MEELLVPTTWEENKSIIKVIGVGGGGGNAVNYMYKKGIKDVSFMVCNTDAQALKHSQVPEKLQLGEHITRGRGAGCNPDIARKAAFESEDKIKQHLGDTTEMVFITAGMGKGTGTGAAPVIAEMAKKMDILTIGVVTLPFRDEGHDFLERALDGIHEMRKHVDSLLIIDNEKLYDYFGELSVFEAFPKADEVLSTAVKGIAEIITRHGFINIDFADVKTVMKDSGMALMGSGSASGERRALKAVEEAFSSPLLNDVNIGSARNVLVNITSGSEKQLEMGELSQTMEYIKEFTGDASKFIRGVVCDPSIGDAIHVTVVATGLDISNLPIVAGKKEVRTETVFLDDEESTQKTPQNPSYRIPDTARRYETTRPEPLKTQKPVPALIMDKTKKIIDYEVVPAYERKKVRITEDVSVVAARSVKFEEYNGLLHLISENTYVHTRED
ncbi:MAG: cell division protein FtsZ [Prevotellaceae bacterium]|jgi:cell division protein FtsZ|nr:cell division protein FtsZ [Prevotellaceae bacterium]